MSIWTCGNCHAMNADCLKTCGSCGQDRLTPPKQPQPSQPIANPAKRVRQEPGMNKTEREWFNVLCMEYKVVRYNAIRLKLANGAWYKPDFMCLDAFDCVHFHEVKGPKAARWSRRGELTIKFAATAWPEFNFVLVWKQDGEWREQEILP